MTSKKFLKNKKSHLKKLRLLQINRMNNKDMIRSAKDFINSKYFGDCYQEMLDYQEKKLLEIKEEYEKIKNQTEKTYFDSLSQEKKEKIICFNGNDDTNDEEPKANLTIICIQDEDSQRAQEIIDKIIQRKQFQIKRKKNYIY